MKQNFPLARMFPPAVIHTPSLEIIAIQESSK